MTLDAALLDAILKILEIVSLVGGGSIVVFKLGRTTNRVEMTLERQNEILKGQSAEMTELKNETKKLNDVLTAIAVQSNRMDRVEADIREMKHWKGFVENGNGSK